MRSPVGRAHPRYLGFWSSGTVRAVAGTGAVDRIARRCAAFAEERPLRIALLEDLRTMVPFDFHMWALTDPETEVSVSPVAAVPDAAFAELPRLIRTRYLTELNRWDRLDGVAASLLGATGGDPGRSLVFRELLRDVGVRDLAIVGFRDRFGCWGWLELWRTEVEAPFEQAELDLLASLAPTVTAALRRCLAHSFDEPAPVPARTGPAVLVLSPQLEVRAQTPETEAYLRALLPPGETDLRPVPAGAYNVAAQLLAVEAGVDHKAALARVHLGQGVWLTFSAARMEAGVAGPEPDIAVTVEPTSPHERRMLFARTHALTARERELIDRLAEGADTKAAAAALYLSEHTIQDHLKSIFAKTGTRNRRTLLARVSGR
jgi:DNA-binding CsgD family transcriptional regulator